MAERPANQAHRSGHRPEARTPLLSTPARAGLLLGASAAVYAVTLAGVSGWQAEAADAATASRASRMDAVTQARAVNDRLEATLARLDSGAKELVDGYDSAAANASDYQARLDELSALVAEVRGTAAALPARIQLPTVTVHGAISGSSRAPATSARTGASGKP